jgi:predicted metal-dependent enzyme (double-stranded beta helix superfamily)
VAAVRDVVNRHADWRLTARLVADALEQHLPSPDVLAAEQRAGDPDGYRSHLLYTEPDGTFSIVALVWRPGQVTAIHDHVTWCVLGVIQGVELRRERLRPAGRHSPCPQRGRGDRDLDSHLRNRRLSDRVERPALLRCAGVPS